METSVRSVLKHSGAWMAGLAGVTGWEVANATWLFSPCNLPATVAIRGISRFYVAITVTLEEPRWLLFVCFSTDCWSEGHCQWLAGEAAHFGGVPDFGHQCPFQVAHNNFRCRGSAALLWPLCSPSFTWDIHSYDHMTDYIHAIKKRKEDLLKKMLKSATVNCWEGEKFMLIIWYFFLKAIRIRLGLQTLFC